MFHGSLKWWYSDHLIRRNRSSQTHLTYQRVRLEKIQQLSDAFPYQMKSTRGWSRQFLTNFTLLGGGGGSVLAIRHAGGSWTRLSRLSLKHKFLPRLFKRRVLHDISHLMLRENQYHRIIRTEEREERANLHYDFLILGLCLAKYEKRRKGRNLFQRG